MLKLFSGIDMASETSGFSDASSNVASDAP
jgi:hypothetical protein